jgi:hypothetical protein
MPLSYPSKAFRILPEYYFANRWVLSSQLIFVIGALPIQRDGLRDLHGRGTEALRDIGQCRGLQRRETAEREVLIVCMFDPPISVGFINRASARACRKYAPAPADRAPGGHPRSGMSQRR